MHSYLIGYVFTHQLRLQKAYEEKVERQSTSISMKVESATERVDRLVYALCRDCKMTFWKPEEKITVQSYRDTDGMYIISNGTCKVHVHDKS